MFHPDAKFQFSEAASPFVRARSLAQVLQDDAQVSPRALMQAKQRAQDWQATLGEILIADGDIDEDQLLHACGRVQGHQVVSLITQPPDPSLADLFPPEFCLKYGVAGWKKIGTEITLVTSRPERIDALREALPMALRWSRLVLAPETQLTPWLTTQHRSYLTQLAESRTPAMLSCRARTNQPIASRLVVAILLLAAIFGSVLAPKAMFLGVLAWVCFAQCATFGMKLTASIATWTASKPKQTSPDTDVGQLPRISMLVPLYKEHDIASALVKRLSRLTYPKPLLEVLLVLEEHDDITHETIACTTLPDWIRVVEVPAGSGLTTKPRALNYALDFCRGDIIGIWDAEDAPAPDQLEKVARHFSTAPKNLACVQGVLDYYNPYTNWLSRCFTIEYATWFRVVLPGLSRMGFAIPLGGTTLFLRRDIIEEVGGWDAHNVTEDADLGIRLARFGYHTEILPCVTQEEANCRPIAWIKQRSRWLKGYMITYMVHMRNPATLLRQVGVRKALGIQLIFAASLTQFLFAPLLWLFWGAAFGLETGIDSLIPKQIKLTMAVILTVFGILNAGIALIAITGQKRTPLYPWVLTMVFYFPLATFAAYKALYELIFRPYFWDKTEHGKTQEGLSADHSAVGTLLEASHKSL